ncbi:c-type cytochrome [Campylobacter fetus]|uniref:Lipoprotein n=1 Tax=Campylobacter fetus subsp. testudinum TaxID=1507806 RepID=A0AAX0HBN3_CAMFE|nr:monoheme c-type cytochrome [Campylobacter fetus]AGZ81340.1 monoheme c-type cytochrome [Campylobacter fetus subsp. testudinum 03-427]AJB45093.1 lipoprotein [Campylobacter fetus subsp. testudinum]ALV64437.1 monoheme c-type cytochrome [Campylobacter fetus subsp. testudinum Sp3]AVK80767.1 hypothetical protein C6B32_02580 [Campylobacter fetus subsp. testudinum]EAI4321739.1 hypothetical protein [Campylobacter fetus]
MKKTVIFASAFLLLVGCSQQDNKFDKNETKNEVTEQNASIVVKKSENQINEKNNWITYDIDGKKSVKFGLGDDNNETTKSIGALAMTRTPLQSINKALIRGTLSKNFIIKCSACHDDYANGIIGPSLLTKSQDEIFKMIEAYKTKTKVNVLMADLVKRMDDKEIMDLAIEISTFNEQFRSKK